MGFCYKAEIINCKSVRLPLSGKVALEKYEPVAIFDAVYCSVNLTDI